MRAMGVEKRAAAVTVAEIEVAAAKEMAEEQVVAMMAAGTARGVAKVRAMGAGERATAVAGMEVAAVGGGAVEETAPAEVTGAAA